MDGASKTLIGVSLEQDHPQGAKFLIAVKWTLLTKLAPQISFPRCALKVPVHWLPISHHLTVRVLA